MDQIRTSFKKHHKLLLFLSIVFIIGLFSGFIYFNVVKDSVLINLKDELFSLTFNSNNFVFHSIVLSIVIIFSFLAIGSILGLFIYFYEAMSVGFILGAFFSYYGVSGFVYGIIYNLIFKILYLLCFTVILIKAFNFSKNVIGYFLLKKDGSLKNLAISNFISIIKFLLIIILNDILLLLIGNNLIEMFGFLIGK